MDVFPLQADVTGSGTAAVSRAKITLTLREMIENVKNEQTVHKQRKRQKEGAGEMESNGK